MAKAKKAGKEEDIDFEAKLEKLQEVVEELEEGELSLTDSIKKYEEGQKMLKTCYETLEKAEKTIEKLGIGPGDEDED